MKETLDILKALSDENRLRIVMMLRVRPLCVCEIANVLPIAGSTLSAHLKQLKTCNVVQQRKDGRWIEYFLENDPNIIKLIDLIEKTISDSDQIADDREKIKKLTRDICTSG